MIQNQQSANKISYTVACVSSFAAAHNLSKKDAFLYLYGNKAIAFLKENYDVEHTLSLDDAVEDMTEICRKNGGVL
ncbi:DUF3791 domain-containing protein [Treponema zioleckii]|uniref:DUF3791 domain-containing protein n=1 Tax=Treponema zioleckii TaxID=331680 RepID=UPI00168AE528|nr:DUF3791 domain-containing protein [Treponema zioleckii]